MAEVGEIVRIHYIEKLDDGRVVKDTRQAGEPVKVKIGSRTLLPALEGALCDMLPGDKRVLNLNPQQAYGAYDDTLVQHVPASAIPNASSLPIGGFVQLATKMGPLRAKVIAANDEEVVLDCNHELAGHAVTFEVEMLEFAHESAIHREMHPAGCACGCDKLKAQLS